MLPCLFKFFATLATGAVGVSVTTPFTYVVTSHPQHKTLWKRRSLNNAGPIISCKGHDAQYSVEMVDTGQSGKGLGLGATFKFFKKQTTYYGRETIIKEEQWKGGGRGSEKWGFKEYWSDIGGDNKEKVGVWYEGRWESGNKNQERISDCNEQKIEIGNARRRDEEIDVSTISFVEGNCKSWFFTKTCDLNISSEKGLKWNNNYQPTITYSAF